MATDGAGGYFQAMNFETSDLDFFTQKQIKPTWNLAKSDSANILQSLARTVQLPNDLGQNLSEF